MLSQFESDAILLTLLQAVLLFQSVNKTLYFIRIYEEFSFILTMATTIAGEVVPFAVFTMGMMIGIAKTYEVLHLGINDANGAFS